MGLNQEQVVFLRHVAELIRKAPEYGLRVTAGELYRNSEYRALPVEKGRSETLNGQHLKRLAIDLNFFELLTDGSLKPVYESDAVYRLGEFWESLDPAANRWGGNRSGLKDYPHFERRENRSSEGGNIPSELFPEFSDVMVLPAPVVGPIRGAGLLTGAVGVRCQNSPYDIESIQRLLNLQIERIALPEPLTCDGKFGNHTLAAITAFQKTVLSQPEPSGSVFPGDATLLALCKALPNSLDETVLSILYLSATERAILGFTPLLRDTMERYDINTPLRQAHFLAQSGHESGELLYRKEMASGIVYENRVDLGNTHPGDGPKFKGRGLIQLTGRANYAAYSRAGTFKVDVEADPEQLAMDDRLYIDVAGWFWDRHGLNAVADRDDLEILTRRINGGLNGLDNRRRLLLRGKTLLCDVGDKSIDRMGGPAADADYL